MLRMGCASALHDTYTTHSMNGWNPFFKGAADSDKCMPVTNASMILPTYGCDHFLVAVPVSDSNLLFQDVLSQGGKLPSLLNLLMHALI